jgi:hypothetical protein
MEVNQMATSRWAIYKSVDELDQAFVVDLPPEEALNAIEAKVPRRTWILKGDRTITTRDPDGSLVANTLKHTPAWAFVVPFGWLLIRRDYQTRITAEPHEGGTLIRVKGKLDSKAATVGIRRLAQTGRPLTA